MSSGNWRTPSVLFDSIHYQWQIISIKDSHVSEGNCTLKKQAKLTCNCKNTNGCKDVLSKEIRLSAHNGKVIKKRISRKRFPNYEYKILLSLLYMNNKKGFNCLKPLCLIGGSPIRKVKLFSRFTFSFCSVAASSLKSTFG